MTALVLLSRSVTASVGAGSTPPGQLPGHCRQYAPLYASIDRDLALYRAMGGISQALVYHTMRQGTVAYREKGLAIGIYNGRVYVISKRAPADIKRFGHHILLWVSYLKVLLDLEDKYGSALPNVEFVLMTNDRPTRLTNCTRGYNPKGVAASPGDGSSSDSAFVTNPRNPCRGRPGINYPVFRFGKSPSNPDILVPIFHFNMQRYQSAYLDRIDSEFNQVPWTSRKQVAFARYTVYSRHIHPNDTHVQRVGANGSSICVPQGGHTWVCAVREHLTQWAEGQGGRVDATSHYHVPLPAMAAYRYLLHTDGQGLSSKLEMLLALGSLVLKEESGYHAFYHHLLVPRTHYLPVWRHGRGPEDILEALDWAQAHDEEARRIAQAGQELVRRYLSYEARACFWLKLLQEYGRVMTYDPVVQRNITTSATGVTAAGLAYVVPARQWIEAEATAAKPNITQTLVWEP